MARTTTLEFRIAEAKAFWSISSQLRRAMRERATREEIELLAGKAENHAKYGVQPAIRNRAAELVADARHLNVRFG